MSDEPDERVHALLVELREVGLVGDTARRCELHENLERLIDDKRKETQNATG